MRIINRSIGKLREVKHKIICDRRYHSDIVKYNKLNTRDHFKIVASNMYPILNDFDKNAGGVDCHYFMQDILVAKMIFDNKPQMHFDIGSRLDGFLSHLLAMNQQVTMLDVRPLPYEIPGLTFRQTNAICLKEIADNSIYSLSCLHAVEHFGLGRYSDPIDPEGCFKAMHEMQRVLAKGGYLYLSVPVGNTEMLCFNAHRIFSPLTIKKEFTECNLIKFIYLYNTDIHQVDGDNFMNFDFGSLDKYMCGIFVFYKS